MIHTIWPEGQPAKAWTTTRSYKAWFYVAAMQIIQLSKLASARRMRWATCFGAVDPADAEEMLRQAGAIAPPGGWHEPMEIGHIPNDLHISTLSVV